MPSKIETEYRRLGQRLFSDLTPFGDVAVQDRP
jgi:hypothetical protein